MNTEVSRESGNQSQFDYEVTGWRIVAALVDFIPLAILFFVMAAVLGETDTEGSSFNANLDGWQAVHFLALTLVYYGLSEAITGTTLGKMLVGLKVVRLDGDRYGWQSALLRNVLRVVDGLPAFYLVGIVSIGVTTWKQRLGDLAAGTQVVRVVPGHEPFTGTSDMEAPAEPDVLSPTDASWKLSKVPGTALAILVVALISGRSIYASPSSAEGTPKPMPNDDELQRLTTSTLMELDRAVQAEDFTSFHKSLAEIWKAEITINELDTAFRSFIVDQASIGGIKDVSPVFDEPPAINKQDILALSGYFPTTPLRVMFELNYVYEDPDWKLIGIALNLAQ